MPKAHNPHVAPEVCAPALLRPGAGGWTRHYHIKWPIAVGGRSGAVYESRNTALPDDERYRCAVHPCGSDWHTTNPPVYDCRHIQAVREWRQREEAKHQPRPITLDVATVHERAIHDMLAYYRNAAVACNPVERAIVGVLIVNLMSAHAQIHTLIDESTPQAGRRPL